MVHLISLALDAEEGSWDSCLVVSQTLLTNDFYLFKLPSCNLVLLSLPHSGYADMDAVNADRR